MKQYHTLKILKYQSFVKLLVHTHSSQKVPTPKQVLAMVAKMAVLESAGLFASPWLEVWLECPQWTEPI